MRRLVLFTCAAALAAFAGAAARAETAVYSYDAKGRLVKVQRWSTYNNGAATEYEHDKANNRRRVKTTGAP